MLKQKLLELREQHNISQNRLAWAIGVSSRALCGLIRLDYRKINKPDFPLIAMKFAILTQIRLSWHSWHANPAERGKDS